MEIRVLKTTDYDHLYALWKSCKGMGLNSVDDTKEGITRFLQRNPDSCFACVDEEKITGAILAGYDGRRGYIYHLAVAPAYRHKGIASKLVEAVKDAFGKMDVTKINLVVFADNEAGNAFWEKTGFTRRDDLIYRNMTLKDMERFDS